MRKPGTDEQNVQMSDVLCDFCQREWTEDIAMVEGHQGSCICGNCLTMAYTAVMIEKQTDAAPPDYYCVMCLERDTDRRELDRGDEPGWQSPVREEGCVCRRCIKLASGALHKDKDSGWRKPKED